MADGVRFPGPHADRQPTHADRQPTPASLSISNAAAAAAAAALARVTLQATREKRRMARGGRAEVADIAVDDVEPWARVKLFKPEDQLDLTEPELREEITRVLTCHNPQQPLNIVEYSHKESCFVPAAPVPETLLLFEMEGTALHKDSEEAQIQLGGFQDAGSVEERNKDEEEESAGAEAGGEGGEGGEAAAGGEEAEEEGGGEEPAPEADAEDDKEEDAGRKDSSVEIPPGAPKKITNQFNYCERASMTFNNSMRVNSTQTIPPPRATFCKQICQYTIYDGYQEDFLLQQQEKEKEKKEKAATQPQSARKSETKKKITGPNVHKRMLSAVKTLERMVNQNLYDDIAQDYRYWEDPSDEFREEEGTLLPLWKFVYERTKRNTITDLCWNPRYYDMFAVSYGTFDFMKQLADGAVCVYSIKNPSYPEYACQTDAAVTSVDIHRNYPYLFVIGREDGNVAVYNIQVPSKEPQFKSKSVEDKHDTVVWQVKWGPNLPDGEINFYSISSDGFVFNWVLTQKDLNKSTIISLALDVEPIAGPDGASIPLHGCGTAIAFHPTEPLLFLVGTEEGYIHKCSTSYTSMFLMSYKAHHLPVHRIAYNQYYPDIFISCSADWRIKLWEDKRSEPLFVFDVASPVGDVEWSPYSSTVFAGVSNDGKVHVFDINVNKYRPICSQAVVSKKRNKLTRLSFNIKLPILIVGDDRGTVTTLKLSPNLRKKVKPPKKGPPADPRELEVTKLEKILALVREPKQLPGQQILPSLE